MKLKFLRIIFFASVVIIVSGLLVFGAILVVNGAISVINENNTKREQIVAAHGSKCKQIAEYMQEYESLHGVNTNKYWPSRITKFIVQKRVGFAYAMKISGARGTLTIMGVYLLKKKQTTVDGSILLGYTDALSLPGKDGICYAFFMSGNEITSATSDEWQIRRIIGKNDYKNKKASFYYVN